MDAEGEVVDGGGETWVIGGVTPFGDGRIRGDGVALLASGQRVQGAGGRLDCEARTLNCQCVEQDGEVLLGPV